MSRHRLAALAGPVLLLLLLTVVALIARPLTPIDETRYVSVAWEMWQKGEFLVPFKNGEPYSHKPPLLFWLYQLGWVIFGVNDWWPRLVSPLFSLGSLLLTFSVASRLWPDDPDVQRRAAWLLSACALWMAFSTMAMFDVMLAFFVLLGARGLLIAARDSLFRGFVWLAVAFGLGILAKGPVVLLHLMPVALLAPWWRGIDGFAWRRWYLGLLLALLGGAALALAWAIPAGLHGGEEYRAAIFWGQTANRMVDSFAHRRPIWWYLPWLPLLLFPWSLWPGFWRRLLAMRQEGLDGGQRFCLAWMLPAFMAFTLISGKQVHYLVPLVPAFALLAARLLAKGGTGGLGFPALLVALVALAMLASSLAGLPDRFAVETDLPLWPPIVLSSMVGLVVRLGSLEQRRVPSLALLAASTLACLQLFLAPILWKIYDVRPLAQTIRTLQDRGVPVAHLGKYHAQFQFAGRLDEPLEQLDEGDLPAWLERHPTGAIVTYSDHWDRPAGALFGQPYRGGFAVLLDAGAMRRPKEPAPALGQSAR
ncbi:MAG: ArnT family glycosyltransferase [Rhodocyclaceae bacterium]